MSDDRSRPWLVRHPTRGLDATREDQATGLDLFRDAVARAGHEPALIYFDGVLTYSEVDAASDALAASLVEHGFVPGDRLALYLQNDPAFVIGLLAAWKAGGAAAALSPMSKERELARLLRDCGATALLALDDLYESVARGVIEAADIAIRISVTVSPLDGQRRNDPRLFSGTTRRFPVGTLDLGDVIAAHDGSRIAVTNPAAADIAMLSYTSGTTGMAKAAINTHRNLVHGARTYRDWVGLEPGEGVLGLGPLFHITGLVGHVMLAMTLRSPLVLSHRFHPEVMLDSIREHRPAFAIAAVTAFIALADVPDVRPEDLVSLRAVYSGGAAIPPSVADRLESELGLQVHNVYGQTETSSPTHAVPFGVRSPVDAESGVLSIGVPVFDTDARIVDDDGVEVPVGDIGELVISGPQVSPGYWGRPDLTEESMPGGQLRTGDIGFTDAAGWYYVLDRREDMINASGFKVWPREVEEVLAMHPVVAEAAVVGIADDYRGQSVKAFVALEVGADVDEAELQNFCRQRMAAYKYPREIEIVAALPRTATGKLMRRDLRDPLA